MNEQAYACHIKILKLEMITNVLVNHKSNTLWKS